MLEMVYIGEIQGGPEKILPKTIDSVFSVNQVPMYGVNWGFHSLTKIISKSIPVGKIAKNYSLKESVFVNSALNTQNTVPYCQKYTLTDWRFFPLGCKQ